MQGQKGWKNPGEARGENILKWAPHIQEQVQLCNYAHTHSQSTLRYQWGHY